jgi:starch-binding outer membrane protein, SusD/RagB family
MKYKIILLLAGLLTFCACTDLDLNPLSEGSSETWYSNESEINMAVNDLYTKVFWLQDDDAWTDDWTYRETLTSITNGTLNSADNTIEAWWKNSYTCIARANTILANLDLNKAGLPQSILNKYVAEARFVRASQYAKLISHFGDVIYFTKELSLDEAFTMSKTDKKIILSGIYDDYDFAALNLPLSYGSSENMCATKGAALAMKARIALYMGDWEIARDAAKACMDLGVYELYPDFYTLFLSKTKNTKETIFSMPQSVELGSYFGDAVTNQNCKDYISRNTGAGWAAKNPSWDLFCAFLCSDGLPIDESPLYNPREPFKNRDPRCTATIVEFQTEHLGFMYQPHPDSLLCWNFNTGKYQKNNDTRANAQYAAYAGMLWKKRVDGDWIDDYQVGFEIHIVRYADVLLMYAEAKIELGEIDQTMLDASINMVRARAYKVGVNETTKYPAVTTTDQNALRKILRVERRMEFAWEGKRYMDIIRWKLAEKVLNTPIYGMLDVASLREKVVIPGLWFFPQITPIDEDGIADFTPMYNAGLIKKIAQRNFDKTKQYLWPIPSKEIIINKNLTQNPGY